MPPADEKRAAAPKNEPVWWIDADLPEYPPLAEDLRVDVGIVGAGIAGLTTAYLLAREGRSVAVLEDGGIGTGMTGATSAHLATALDRRYSEIAKVRGAEGALLAAESHSAAIDRIERIVSEERIACGFARRDGYLFLAPGDDPSTLDAELEAAHAAGLSGVEKVSRAPLPSFDTGPCLRFPRQAQFHPLHYLAGVAKAVEKAGGRIFGKTHVDEIAGGADARLRSRRRTVACGAVVVATNSPVNDLVAIHTKQAPYMTYVIGAIVPRGAVPQALYWDTADPFHYVRVHPLPGGDDCLVVGGEDHKSGQADDVGERHTRLEAWARERVPEIREIGFTWAGQVMETLDGLAFIGRNPMDAENVFIVTGDSGNGLTHGTVAGLLLTDLVLGRESPWAELYDPSRKPVRAAGEFFKEAANMAAQYADWVTPGDVDAIEAISPGEGAVIREGLKKLAVYKGPRGAVHALSAVCPHLGCIVQWNTAEKTWDCPCHGSRFDKVGKVINGPANRDLDEVGRR